MFWIYSLFIASTSLVLLIWFFFIFTVLLYNCLGENFDPLKIYRSISSTALWDLPGRLLNLIWTLQKVDELSNIFLSFFFFRFTCSWPCQFGHTFLIHISKPFSRHRPFGCCVPRFFSVRCPAASFKISVSTKIKRGRSDSVLCKKPLH